MSNEVNYMDSEFSITGSEKIDYKTILFKQIDYIRFLKTQDVGDFTLFQFGVNPTDEMFFTWLKNLSVYKNSVQSLKLLIKSYHDDKFNIIIDKINKYYTQQKIIEIKKLTKKSGNYSNPEIEIHNQQVKKMCAIIYEIKTQDRTFEECLLLIQRAKFIGGNDMLKEMS